MAEQTEQIEQYAQKIWSLRTIGDSAKIAEQCGESKLDRVEWDQLPDKVKDHLRAMAAPEVAAMQTPPTEIEQYLISLFRELNRLRPAATWSAASHGIMWDHDWERLVLLINVCDAVYVHPLTPGNLTSDPIATAANLWAKAEPEIDKPDADVIGFKR